MPTPGTLSPAATLWVRNDQGMYADDAGTIPAVDGDPVKRWENLQGTDYLFQFTSANAFLFSSTGGDRKAISDIWRVGSAFDNRILNLFTNFLLSVKSITLMMVIEPLAADRYGRLFSGGSFGVNYFSLFLRSGTFWLWDGTTEYNTGLYVPCQKCIVIWTSSATEVKVYLNSTTNVFSRAAFPIGAFTIQGGEFSSPSGQGAWYDMWEAAIWNSGLTTANAQLMFDYGVDRYHVTTTYKKSRNIFEGDSHTEGIGTTRNRTYAKRLGIPKEAYVTNHGMTSQTIADAQADAATDIFPQFVSGMKNRLFVDLASNTIAVGVSGATAYAQLKAYTEAATAVGFEVYLATVSSNLSPFNTNRDDLNTLLREHFTIPTDNPYVFKPRPDVTWGVKLHDKAANPFIGTGSGYSLTYWLSDQVHLNDVGYDVWAAMIRAGTPELSGELIITKVEKQTSGQWRFEWTDTGADVYRITYRGHEITEVVGTSYDLELPWGKNYPPPLEIVPDDETAISEIHPPYMTPQWYRSAGADHYRVEQESGASWLFKADIADNGQWVYTYDTVTLDDETTYKFRVLASGTLSNFSDDIWFRRKIVRPPDPVTVNVTWASGNLTIAAA